MLSCGRLILAEDPDEAKRQGLRPDVAISLVGRRMDFELALQLGDLPSSR